MIDAIGIGAILSKIGILTLIYLTYHDMKTGKIDTRKSNFMIGAVLIGFLSTQQQPILILPLFAISWGLSGLYKKTYGTGDLINFYWIIPLMFILNFWYPFAFMLLLGLTTIFVTAIKKWKNIIDKTPGLINFTSAYLLIVGGHFYYQLWPTGCAIQQFCYFF